MPFHFWLINRIMIPLAAAGYLLIDRWGKDNLAFYIAIPPFFAIFRMCISQFERPECPQLEDDPNFRRAVYIWHACDLIGLLFVMFFEIIIAVIAEEQATIVWPYGIAFGLMFTPYAVLAVLARRYSQKANSLAQNFIDRNSENRSLAIDD